MTKRAITPTPIDFIRENLRLAPAPAVPEISLYQAHPTSRLSRLGSDAPPYWAYHWAGGTVLARYVLDHPHIVKDRRVIDLGAGSGIVGIATALCGAADVTAYDVDAFAIAATTLNAAANGVSLKPILADLLDGAAPDADIILVGDLFYDQVLADRVIAFLRLCKAAGIDILVGDPGRKPLPLAHLKPLMHYPVPDFGHVAGSDLPTSTVFDFDGGSANF